MAGSEIDYEAPRGDRVRDARDLAEQSPLRGLVGARDYQETTTREAERRMTAGRQLEASGVLPEFRIADTRDNRNALDRSPADRLLDSNLAPEAKLKAVEDLARQGVRTVRVKDADGTERDC